MISEHHFQVVIVDFDLLEFDAESFVAEIVLGMILKEEISISPSGDYSERHLFGIKLIHH